MLGAKARRTMSVGADDAGGQVAVGEEALFDLAGPGMAVEARMP